MIKPYDQPRPVRGCPASPNSNQAIGADGTGTRVVDGTVASDRARHFPLPPSPSAGQVATSEVAGWLVSKDRLAIKAAARRPERRAGDAARGASRAAQCRSGRGVGGARAAALARGVKTCGRFGHTGTLERLG